MADLLKTTIAAGATNSDLTALTEHGSVKVGLQGNVEVLIEQELDDSPVQWGAIYQGRGPAVVIDYVGTKLRFTNMGDATTYIRVGEPA